MKAVLLVGLVIAAGLSLAVAMPRNEVSSLLDLSSQRSPAPPELRLLSPRDGEGVGFEVAIRGEALSAARDVIDVQVRVDDGRWESIPDIARGLQGTPFSLTVPLAPGDHAVEARAWDGEAYSLPARASVRRDAPTIQILLPLDGAGIQSGEVELQGIVVGQASGVALDVDGTIFEATFADGHWSARVPVADGIHVVRATALATIPSLPATVRLAADRPAPGSLTILAPTNGSSFGESGDLACPGGCVLFAGASRDTPKIGVRLDGRPAGDALVVPGGAWSYRLPMARLASGPHLATFTPEGGVPMSIAFLARTPIALQIRGDLDARPTGSALGFTLAGGSEGSTEWSLDGAPVGEGASTSVSLSQPGDHTLAVQTSTSNGHVATTSVTLHALNRAPDVTLADAVLLGADIRLEASAQDPDGAIASYHWEFGDGGTATSRTPGILHRYLVRGTFLANVTVVDDIGAIATTSTLVLVPNVAPLANFTFTPEHPTILDVVRFADTSRDLDGRLVSREWSFDGVEATDNVSPVMRFATRGPHTVQLRVGDEDGLHTTWTRIVEVVDLAPQAAFSWQPALPRSGDEVFFADRSSDVDGPIATRAWSFGDGSNGSGAGALHAFAAPGLYEVSLEVVDDAGLAANITLPVRIVDGQPTITAVVADPPRPRAQQIVQLRASAIDREGGIVGLSWDFGDGSSSNASEPLHRYARSGHYAGLVTVFDEAGLATSFPFAIDVVNAPPSALLRLAKGGWAAFPSVLELNATDPDGHIAIYRFDVDGDGFFDCVSTGSSCEFTFETPGVYGSHAEAEDDEGALVETTLILDIAAPPSHLAPPVVTIASPTPRGLLRGDFLVRGNAEGVRPIERVDLQLRSGSFAYSGTRDAWHLANGGVSWTSLLDTRAFADGEYEIVVRATDTGGGEGFARVPVQVLNGARPNDVTLQVLDAPDMMEEDAFVRGSAFHPQGVTSVRWRVDNDPWRYVSESPLAFTLPLDADTLATGGHLLQVEAYHGPTEKATFERVFRVLGDAPTLVVDDAPAPVAHALLAARGRIVGEGHAQWRLDHDIWRDVSLASAWNLSVDTLDVEGGDHVLSLRAVSHDGRLASVPSTYKVQIVNPPFAHSEPQAASPPLAVPMPTWALLVGVVAAAVGARRGRILG